MLFDLFVLHTYLRLSRSIFRGHEPARVNMLNVHLQEAGLDNQPLLSEKPGYKFLMLSILLQMEERLMKQNLLLLRLLDQYWADKNYRK